ncbi:MAG: cysteine hydrolase [Gammaproteobacteria bacterium]|nr:cysteine hydrolase [Gammaproteobacteria bacterium]
MTRALIIIDVQNDYFAGGSMELSGMDAAADNCARLLASFRATTEPLFHIQHLATRPGSTFFVPDTPGCEINARVRPQDDEPVVVKHFPSAFRDTELHQLLQDAGVDELIICGAMTHMCVDTTVRAAFDLGYKCHVIADACATRDLAFDQRPVPAADVQAAFMAALSAPFAQISSAAQLLDNS